MERLPIRRARTGKVAVLLVDGNEKLATLIAQLLADEDQLRVVGLAHDAGAAVRLARGEQPDVILVDTKLGGIGTPALCSALRAACDAAVLVWVSEPDRDLEQSPYVDGLIERGLTFRELVRSILAVVRSAGVSRPETG